MSWPYLVGSYPGKRRDFSFVNSCGSRIAAASTFPANSQECNSLQSLGDNGNARSSLRNDLLLCLRIHFCCHESSATPVIVRSVPAILITLMPSFEKHPGQRQHQ